jgi:phage-related protein
MGDGDYNLRPCISFRGISSADLGLLVEQMPDVPVGARVYEKLTVAGRDGVLTLDTGRMAEVQLKCVVNCFGLTDADAARAWLSGHGRLILSDCPDRYYNAWVSAQSSSKRLRAAGGRNYDSVTVTFTAEPYAYDLRASDIDMTAAGTVVGVGTAFSEPLVRVYSVADGTLTLGDRSLAFTAPDEYVDIDMAAKLAYKGDAAKSSTITLSQAEWPRLEVGENAVSFTGATRIVISPRWRWI